MAAASRAVYAHHRLGGGGGAKEVELEACGGHNGLGLSIFLIFSFLGFYFVIFEEGGLA